MVRSAARITLIAGCLALLLVLIGSSFALAQTPYLKQPTDIGGTGADTGGTIPDDVQGAGGQRQRGDGLPVTGGDLGASTLLATFLILTGVLMVRRDREAKAHSAISR